MSDRELFDAAALAEFYRDLAEHGGEIQCQATNGEWVCVLSGPNLLNGRDKWRIYRKPVPREWWMVGRVAYTSESSARYNLLCDVCEEEVVHVREVIE